MRESLVRPYPFLRYPYTGNDTFFNVAVARFTPERAQPHSRPAHHLSAISNPTFVCAEKYGSYGLFSFELAVQVIILVVYRVHDRFFAYGG